jgi:hypothetical protein
MRARLPVIVIALLMCVAIAVVWMFPRSRGAARSNAGAATAYVPGGTSSTGGSAVAGGARGAGCAECQKRECWNLIDGCSTLQGNATEGAAQGTPKSALCDKMLECARRTTCDVPVSIQCYCGQTDLGSCLAGKATGACRAAVEAAAETTDPGTVFKRLKDKTYASGVAEPLLTCETRGCKDECVPYYR